MKTFPSYLLLLGLFMLGFQIKAQSGFADSLLWENYQYRLRENQDFADSTESPLNESDRLDFTSLNWFPVDTNFMVWARLERTPETEAFEMPTTTERKPIYRQYGILHFSIGDSSFAVPVYQNLGLIKMPQYKDYLFFPFTDLSNGFGTYGGGRYLDIRIPEGNSLLLDFNRAYNPYCAYNDRYSCPIPPSENHIPFTIRAGVRYEVKH
jgi:uncharacterized protein (DUF1684 family)